MTNAQGQFSVTTLKSGNQQWLASKTGYLTAKRYVNRDIQAETTIDLGELRLRPLSAEVVLPDLQVQSVDTSGLSTDQQSLVIQGLLKTTIINKGNSDTSIGFEVEEINPLMAVAVILGIAVIAIATDGVGLIALAGTAESAAASLVASGAAAIQVVQFGVGASVIFYAEGTMAATPPSLPPITPQPTLDLGRDHFNCPEALMDRLQQLKNDACKTTCTCKKPKNIKDKNFKLIPT